MRFWFFPRISRHVAYGVVAVTLLAAPTAAGARVQVTRTADEMRLVGDINNERVVIGARSVNGVPMFTVTPTTTSTQVSGGFPCTAQTGYVACPQQGITKVAATLAGGADKISFSTAEAEAAASALHATFDGGDGIDVLLGGSGNDELTGGPGDDQMSGGGGSDTFSGGDGSDLVSYEDRSEGISVSLDGVANDGAPSNGGTEGDNVDATVERVVGGGGDDTLTGDGNMNAFDGGPGNDSIDGGEGSDSLLGGEGDDTITTRDSMPDSADCGEGSADRAIVDGLDTTTACETIELPKPPADDPPADDPPADDPPADDPPADDPPAKDPPAKDPPAKDPKQEEPSQEQAPVQQGTPTQEPARTGSSATTRPRLKFSRTARFNRRGLARIRAICAPASSCTGKLRILSGGKVIGRQTFAIAGGEPTPFHLAVNKKAQRRLARKRVLRAVLVGRVTDGNGTSRKFRRKITLKAPRTRG